MSHRLMMIKMIVGEVVVAVLPVYEPQSGLPYLKRSYFTTAHKSCSNN